MRNDLILALGFAASLAGAAAWPATEWAAQNDAQRIAAEQCRKNGLSCETQAKKPKRKTDACAVVVASETVALTLSVLSSEPK